MRSFGVIRCSFWTGATGRALRKDRLARDLANYLMTGPYSDVCGFYRLALPTLAHDLGTNERVARGDLARLEALDFCGYDDDHEVVGVWRLPLYQLGGGKPDDKRLVSVRRQLAAISHRFARRIEAELAGDLPTEQGEEDQDQQQQGQGHAREASPSGSASDTLQALAKPLPSPSTPFGQWVSEHWSDVDNPDAWGVTLAEAYPVIDILAEARKALAWEESSPANRKQRHGRYFANWLARAQDRGTGAKRQSAKSSAPPLHVVPPAPSPEERAESAARAEALVASLTHAMEAPK